MMSRTVVVVVELSALDVVAIKQVVVVVELSALDVVAIKQVVVVVVAIAVRALDCRHQRREERRGQTCDASGPTHITAATSSSPFSARLRRSARDGVIRRQVINRH